MIETVIPEEEVPLILKQYNKIALKLVKQSEFERALEALSRSDEILEALQAAGSELDNHFRLETSHNRSICLQRLGLLEDCAASINHCLEIIKIKKSSIKTFSEKIFLSRYVCKSRVRLCAIFSQLKENEKALRFAFKAEKNIRFCLEECLLACKEQIKLNDKISKSSRLRNRFAKQQQYKLFESPHYLQSQNVINQALPYLKVICKQFKTKKSQKINNVKGLFQGLDMEWINNWNIGDIMVIQPYETEGAFGGFACDQELTKEKLFEKTLLIVVTQFCIATEIRNLIGKNINYSKRDAYLWHKKAVRNAKMFLSTSSALCAHVNSTFQTNFSKEIQKEKKKKEIKPDFGKTLVIHTKTRIDTLNPDQLKSIYRPRSSSSRLNRTILKDDRRALTSLNATISARNKLKQKSENDKEIFVKQALGFDKLFNKEESPNKSLLSTNDKTAELKEHFNTENDINISS